MSAEVISLDARRLRPSLVGTSPVMRALDATIHRVAGAAVPVLLRGESGTGKELVARAIHAASPRRTGRFVAVLLADEQHRGAAFATCEAQRLQRLAALRAAQIETLDARAVAAALAQHLAVPRLHFLVGGELLASGLQAGRLIAHTGRRKARRDRGRIRQRRVGRLRRRRTRADQCAAAQPKARDTRARRVIETPDHTLNIATKV